MLFSRPCFFGLVGSLMISAVMPAIGQDLNTSTKPQTEAQKRANTAAANEMLAKDEVASTGASEPSVLKPRDIFDIEYATDPQISPDGTRIVYHRRIHDIMSDRARTNLWVVNSDGTNHRPLASGRPNYTGARWSKDGSRVAFVSSFENDQGGAPQIYVKWLDTGDQALISDLEYAPRTLSWSPDGTMIAFVMDVPLKTEPLAKMGVKKPKGAKWSEPFKVIETARFRRDGRGFIDPARSHIFVVPADGGSPRQLTRGDFNHSGPLSWSPDGQSILFSANRHDGWELETIEADIFSIDLSGNLTRLTDFPGAENSPIFSPDAAKIAFIKSENKALSFRINRLTIMDTSAKNVRTLTKDFDHSISNIAWSKDGQAITYLFDKRGERYVGQTDLSGKHRTLVRGVGGTTVGRPYISGGYSIAPNGTIAYTSANSHRPADVATARGGKAQKVTDLNSDTLGDKSLGVVNEINFKSKDGEDIQGWYITPPDFDPGKNYPLLLEIHGGPALAYGPHFSLELQRYAAEGYVVVYDNHRGSSSYGERFGLLLHHKYPGTGDFEDHMAAVDAVIAKGFIDEDQLYIVGGSAGGVATAYAVGLTNRFKAAVAHKPIINWTSKVLTADSYIYQSRHQFPGLPWEELDHYWERSPLSLVGNVTTPTLLMTGEEDYRTPITESEQFYQALKLRGIDSALVRVPGSGHGIAGRPSRMISKIEHTLAWLSRYRDANAASEIASTPETKPDTGANTGPSPDKE